MKINKIFILAGVLLSGMLSLNSCSNDDDFTAGPEVATDCPQLYFSDDETQNIEIDPADPTSLDITIYRSNTQNEGTYSIIVLSNQDDVFNVPESVTFAEGQEEAVITATFNNAEIGKSYTLELGFDDADINPYKTDKKFSAYTITRVKWNLVGTGDYTYIPLFWQEYDEGLDIYQRDDDPSIYKIADWGLGVDFIFTWDGKDKVTVPISYTGYSYPGYGNVYVSDLPNYDPEETYDDFPCSYDEDTQTFTFNVIYWVEAGYFDYGEEKLKVTWDTVNPEE